MKPRDRVPALTPRGARPPRTAASGFYVRPLLVLVVDDQSENREVYREYLTALGFRIVEAANGALAIDVALAHRPDAIVMDLDMPVMDGFEATRVLKSDPRTNAIPVVLVTAEGAAQHANAMRAGCDAFLVKPCLLEDLQSVLEICVRGGRERTSKPPEIARR